MTYEDLLDLLSEQFSCDINELTDDLELDELGIDHEDMIELAWGLGEAVGQEISEADVARCATVGELWRMLRELDE